MSILTIGYGSKIVDGAILIENSQGDRIHSNNPKDLLDFLAKNYTDALNRKMCWNIDTLIAPILKLLGMDICKELVAEPDCEALWRFTDNVVEIYNITEKKRPIQEGLYSLYYHRQTSFGLEVHGERKSYFYNLSQFYETDEDITDAKIILDKANELVNAFFAMGLNPLKMSSPISVYQANVLEKIEFPTVADLPKNLSEEDCNEFMTWAEEIMHREWTTNMAVGHWHEGETYHADISSAYGFFFSDLYDYIYDTFRKSDKSIKEADEGILKGTVSIIPNIKCSPICYQTPSGQIINPVGCSWNDKFTLSDIRWLYRHKIGTFELDYGYFWKQNAPVQPFKVIMERIFNNREQGGLVKKLAKRIGASAWSKSIQKATGQGGNPFYSPLLALQVKTNCRLEVANFIWDRNLQNSVLMVGTDATRTTIPFTVSDKYGMGSWELEEFDPCIILSPARIYTPTHKPGGLYYEDIIKMINENPNETYYDTILKRPITLGEAIEMEDINKVGEIGEFHTSIDLVRAKIEQDMEFKDFPMCGKDLLEKKYYGKEIII